MFDAPGKSASVVSPADRVAAIADESEACTRAAFATGAALGKVGAEGVSAGNPLGAGTVVSTGAITSVGAAGTPDRPVAMLLLIGAAGVSRVGSGGVSVGTAAGWVAWLPSVASGDCGVVAAGLDSPFAGAGG